MSSEVKCAQTATFRRKRLDIGRDRPSHYAITNRGDSEAGRRVRAALPQWAQPEATPWQPLPVAPPGPPGFSGQGGRAVPSGWPAALAP